jgi:serine phosphatase RsbU (regulator of sigma subunit)
MRSLFKRAKRPQPLTCEPLRSDAPELREGAIAAVYYGQRQAGDFYDFVRVHPGRVLFGLFDAAGDVGGTRSIICSAQGTFRALGASLFAEDDINEADAMIELCLELNRSVLNAAQCVCPCPAFVGCYNEDLGIVSYFNTGHTPGLVRNQLGVTELPATGLPLGLFSHATCDAGMVVLEPGASLLLVSKGLVEGKRDGQEFGLERVKQGLQQTNGESAKELCVAVLGGIRQYMKTPPTHNDVTALALVRSGKK